MDRTIKNMLKNEIRAVGESKLKVIIGIGLLVVNIILLVLGYLSIPTLIFTCALVYTVWDQIAEYRINKAVLFIMRYILDEEFARAWDEKNLEDE